MNDLVVENVTTLSRRGPFDYGLVDKAAATEARQAAKRIKAVEKAATIDIGRDLIKIKNAMPNHFLEWIEAECNYTRRTATNLMSVATAFADTWETVSHLPPTTLYALAAPSTPAEIREAVTKAGPGRYADPKAVKHLINMARTKDPEAEQAKEAERLAAIRTKEEASHADNKKRDAEVTRALMLVDFLRAKLGAADFAELQKLLRGVPADDLRYQLLTAS